jgi:TetR/AcrR family transcriptional regulator, cholesterol catabolism regulator
MNEVLPSGGPAKRANPAAGRKAAATRQRLVEAASRVLAQRGYSGTRLADVAEAAGIQAPAIYYHFNNKEELAIAVIREGLVRSRSYLLEALAQHGGDDPVERLGVAIEAHLRIATEERDAAPASLRRSSEVPESVRALCRPEERAYAREWKKLLADAHQAGLIRDGLDLVTAQIMLLGALNSFAETWKPGRNKIEDAIRSARSLLLNGLSDQVGARSDAIADVSAG